jgi:protein TonB
MRSENRLRLLLFAGVAALHILLILFFAINMTTTQLSSSGSARAMRVFDFDEAPPPPPAPQMEEVPVVLPPMQETVTEESTVESIAETMIETETEPDKAAAPGSVAPSGTGGTGSGGDGWGDYLGQHLLSAPPQFNEREIQAALVYPPIALRSGIEGRVILELFVDRNGLVQQVRILQETPKDRGFGEAAIRAFTGRRGIPAQANGGPVSSRYRYPVSFRIR